MRIIAGTAKGRILQSPRDQAIRPTSDKVRGAIFNALKSRVDIEGAVVLDCFCGSGALGLEALSRGAAQCIFIDKERESLDLARANAKALNFSGQSHFILVDVNKIKRHEDAPAALAFLDPPYHKNLVLPALQSLAARGWLAAGAVCVVETEKGAALAVPGFTALTDKVYGTTQVHFLQLISGPDLAQ